MEAALQNFLHLLRAIVQQCEAGAGALCWCDAADPCTGWPVRGLRGRARWSEVAGLHGLLGYAVQQHGPCPISLHPQHGMLEAQACHMACADCLSGA